VWRTISVLVGSLVTRSETVLETQVYLPFSHLTWPLVLVYLRNFLMVCHFWADIILEEKSCVKIPSCTSCDTAWYVGEQLHSTVHPSTVSQMRRLESSATPLWVCHIVHSSLSSACLLRWFPWSWSFKIAASFDKITNAVIHIDYLTCCGKTSW